MKKISIIVIFLSLFSFSSLGGNKYDACVLKYLSGTGSDVAAKEIINACKSKYELFDNLVLDKEKNTFTLCVETETITTDDIIFLEDEDLPFTGKNYCEYGGGVVKSRGQIKNGKRDGQWTWWTSNGQLGLELNYIEGRKNGKMIQWFEKLSSRIGLDGQKFKEGN